MLGWFLLRLELERWRRAGMRPCFWWRDDDAQALTGPLCRLLQVAKAAGAPLALAVVPGSLDPALPGVINAHPNITVVQHGVYHRNDGPSGHPHEFAAALIPAEVSARLLAGWRALAAFTRRAPVYVPPWNQLPPNVAEALTGASLTAVSAWGGEASATRVDTHLDLLRWQPRPRFKGRDRLLNQLVRALAHRRLEQKWRQPIGLLSHHLDHDHAAWSFLEALLHYRPLREQSDWLSIDSLLDLDVGLDLGLDQELRPCA